MEKQFENPLTIAVRFLEKHDYRYAIIGGIALSQWGYVRATYDIDIKVLVPGTDYATVRKDIRVAFPDRAMEGAPENPFIVAVNIHGVIVDFLLTLPGYEQLIVERAVRSTASLT